MFFLMNRNFVFEIKVLIRLMAQQEKKYNFATVNLTKNAFLTSLIELSSEEYTSTDRWLRG